MSDFPEHLQKYAIPKAEENKAGEKWGQPGTPPTSRERLMKKATQVVDSVPKGSASPHMANGVNVDKLNELAPERLDPDSDTPVNPTGSFGADPMFPDPSEPGLHPRTPLREHENFDPTIGGNDFEVPFQDPTMLSTPVVKSAGAMHPSIPPPVQYVEKPCERCTFLEKEDLVVFELADGTFQVPCLDVRDSRLAVSVLIPTKGMSFIPKPGTKLGITYRTSFWTAYYPGTYVSYPELGYTVLMFIKETEDEG